MIDEPTETETEPADEKTEADVETIETEAETGDETAETGIEPTETETESTGGATHRSSRRTFLKGAGVAGVGPGLVCRVTADENDPEPAYSPKITTLKYPLTGVPIVVPGGETVRIELDLDAPPAGLRAWLEPTFGEARPATALELVGTGVDDSAIWDGETHVVAEFRIPGVGGDLVPDVHDLHVAWDGGSDAQPRAVSVVESYPETPKIAVLADPQVGDPRPLKDGLEESLEDGSAEPFRYRATETFGVGAEKKRWAAFRRAASEINAVDPDVVLFAGDFVYGQDLPGKYLAEYEAAYEILNLVRAPTYATLGNHDGYVQSGIDGKELYEDYFAPRYYAVDVTPDLHLASLDTFDWPAADRLYASVAGNTWGGQVRDDQLRWLEADLRGAAERNPDATLVTLGHHDPSWIFTPQVTDALADGEEPQNQAWAGENRLELRDLLADAGVAVHFAGHFHGDRVARYHEGNVAETPGRGDFPPAELHYVRRDDTLDESRSQDELAEIIREPSHGTLFVETTTCGSTTRGGYWGWRLMEFETERGGVDPAIMGYPATEEFLREHALDPDSLNPDHADLGLFSYPSYFVRAERVEETETRTKLYVENGLDVPIDGSAIQSLAASSDLYVENATLDWRRIDGGEQDAQLGFGVDAHYYTTLVATTLNADALRAAGSRTDDGSAFTGGQTDRIDLRVSASEPVALRDTVPIEWGVSEARGDVARVEADEARGVRYVYFDGDAATDRAVTYFADAPDEPTETGVYEFGPIEVRAADEDYWVRVPDTTETNAVVGRET
ncbi:metallophosphoesterase family protein [Halegenticoccus tardaugens]|uniref:metallophosphoesterase family protein n=1 Tax=Halegenticoccus tardaugens TaxID=2071624 RepID=UPI00100A3B90|nr:metallophosphoesterase [Halegenticoccus tardaugens]